MLALAGVLSVLALAAGILVAASLIFAKLEGVANQLPPLERLYCWITYFRLYADDRAVRQSLDIAAAVPLAVVLVLFALVGTAIFNGRRGGRYKLRPAGNSKNLPKPVRAASTLHGDSDWMDMKDVQALFPGPHPQWGGIVIGEAYRVDEDKAARKAFDPENRKTWGKGGTAPLLVDPATNAATHGLVFAGSGGYKTTGIVIPTLHPHYGWKGSMVVLDPSCQAGPMSGRLREQAGQKIYMVGLKQHGFNVLDWIDTADPLAEQNLVSIIETIGPEQPKDSSGDNGMFHKRGKDLQRCLLAHMLWDDSIPKEQKTLKRFMELMTTPETKMKGLLQEIADESKSPLARRLARTLSGVVQKTFSGMYANAISDLSWLMIDSFADIVSGDDFTTADLTREDMTVYIQIPMTILEQQPELARVVISSLLQGVYRAEGKVKNRILFLLDEVALLKRMSALSTARDNARKYKITLLMIWQNLGQAKEDWKQEGMTAWFASSSWQMFAAVNDDYTAAEISKGCGSFTALSFTEGQSTSNQSGSRNTSNNRGRNYGVSEVARELIKPSEVRNRMRADEQIIFRTGGGNPIRCGRAIYFRRPDMMNDFGADKYRSPVKSDQKQYIANQ